MSYFDDTIALLESHKDEPLNLRANAYGALLPRVHNAYSKVSARNMIEEMRVLTNWMVQISEDLRAAVDLLEERINQRY